MKTTTSAEMRVEAQDAQLFVSWRNASRQQHDDWVEAMRSIKNATFDRQRRCWIVPADQADSVYAKFPDAFYSYEAIGLVVEARQRRHRALYKNLIAAGLTLEFVDGRLVTSGNSATQVLQSYLDARPDFAEFVRALTPEETAAIAAAFAPPSPPSARPASSEELRQAELFAASLQNAGRNQYQEEAMHQRRRRRKRAV